MAKLTGSAYSAHEDETKDFYNGKDLDKWVDYACNEMGCAGMALSLVLRGEEWQISIEAEDDKVSGKLFKYNPKTGEADIYGPIECKAKTEADLYDLMLLEAATLEKEEALEIAAHPRWFNTKRQQHYLIVGVVRSCEAPDWELLYQREGTTGEYFHRPAWEWLEKNRNGVQRFTKA